MHSTSSRVGSCTSPPASIPAALWQALALQFNDSQVRAIRAVCDADAPPSGAPPSSEEAEHPCFTLLQGPPGTGKTRTILALVSVLLCGAAARAAASRPGSIKVGQRCSTPIPCFGSTVLFERAHL